MVNYACINNDGYCTGVSSLSDEVIADNMILIDDYDTSYLRRRYDRQNKQWTDEYLPVPEQPIELTLEDIKSDTAPIKATTSLTADDALTIMEYQTVLDEKLSQIITHLGL